MKCQILFSGINKTFQIAVLKIFLSIKLSPQTRNSHMTPLIIVGCVARAKASSRCLPRDLLNVDTQYISLVRCKENRLPLIFLIVFMHFCKCS